MTPTSLFGFDAWAALGPPVLNHLWQSTLFAAAAALLALAWRRSQARARHWIWLAASVKFLVPFSLLVALGNDLGWRTAPARASLAFSILVEPVGQPAGAQPHGFRSAPAAPVSLPRPVNLLPVLIAAVWLCGSAAVAASWCVRWRRIRAVVRAGAPMLAGREVAALRRVEKHGSGIELVSCRAPVEPGVVGILRPVLLWPEGISERLSNAQIEAIVAHELCHVRRRDNLASALHVAVSALFWFHPLVWWLGGKLVDERERACDEEVLGLGSEPEVYAKSILTTCEFSLCSPTVCVAGVTGSNLKERIERIMTHPVARSLTLGRKALLAGAGISALLLPVVIGTVNAPRSPAQAGAAQTPGARPVFEVASIKPADPDARGSSVRLLPGGGLSVTNGIVKRLIGIAYDVRDFQISGAPGWLGSEKFDILAKPERPEGPTDFQKMTDEQRVTSQQRMRQRLQALLADRFNLAVHVEQKDLPIYALVVVKRGPKLRETKDGSNQHIQTTMGRMKAEASTLQMLTTVLSAMVGRPVVDRTGLNGKYDFELEWMPEAPPTAEGAPVERPVSTDLADPTGKPSIFTAIQEQLGLKLESQKGPVDIIVIDRVAKPSPN